VTWPPSPSESSPTTCFRLGADYWIWQDGIGGVSFRADEPALTAFPAPDTDSSRFEKLIAREWLPAVYPVWGRQVLHASAVARRATGDVVAFTGPRGAGKSTMAFSLACRPGWIQIADDTLAFAAAQGRISLHPLPNDVRLRAPAAAHFGRADRPSEPVPWPDMDLTLRRVYVLDAGDERMSRAVVAPLAPAESYLLLLEQAHTMTLSIPAHNQRLMRDYLALTAQVPAFRLSYRRSFDHLAGTLDDLERHSSDSVAPTA
jgi:hypothetical protein